MVSEAIAATTWGELRHGLDAARLRIQREICAYPMPIPACDAHFNFLLAQRALLADQLRRLDKAAIEAAASDDPHAALEAFAQGLRTERAPELRHD